MNEGIYQIVRDLFITPNGRLFFIGSILSAGSGYYVFENQTNELVFAYVVLGVGSVFILISMIMASFSAHMKSRERVITMEMDKEIREARMEHGEADKTIYKVDE